MAQKGNAMKRLLFVAMLVLSVSVWGSCGAGVQSVLAQDAAPIEVATVDAMPVSVAVLLAVVLVVTLAALVLIVRPAIGRLAESVPPWALSMALDGADYGLQRLQGVAARTTPKYDDDLVQSLIYEVKELREELDALKARDKPGAGADQ